MCTAQSFSSAQSVSSNNPSLLVYPLSYPRRRTRDSSLKPLVLGFQKSQIRTVLLPEVEANTSAWLELQEEIEVHAVVVLFKCMDTDGVVPGRGVPAGWVEIDECVWWGVCSWREHMGLASSLIKKRGFVFDIFLFGIFIVLFVWKGK